MEYKDAEIILYDDQCHFRPVIQEVLDELTFYEKKLIKGRNAKNESPYKPVHPFALKEEGGTWVGATYPGFWRVVMNTYKKHHYLPIAIDRRRSKVGVEALPPPALDKMYGFRGSQEELLTEGLKAERSGLIGAPTRFGKCLCVDTEVLMYDGTVKPVQYIIKGDKLMGPDGQPRVVVALGTGKEATYKIIPNKGEPFYCNESHILSLKVTGGAKMGGYQKGDIVNISVRDYIKRSKTFKHITKLWYASLDYSHQDLPFDPWMVGVWLGDGCSDGRPQITKPDKDIQAGIIAWAESVGMPWSYKKSNVENDTIVVSRQIKTQEKNPLTELARYCTDEETGTKYIPTKYITSSRQQRLELLAGLIDTDGYNVNNMGYEIVTKYETLAKGIIRLCRSLGFRVTRTYVQKGIKSTGFKGWYWRLQIAGKLEDIPCRGHKKIYQTAGRVDPTLTGFTVEKVPDRKYYGFELEGPDKLFLLWDNLVTHNTALIVNTVRAFPTATICLVAPGVDLVKQLYSDLTGKFGVPGRNVYLVHGSKKLKGPVLPGDIVVCSVDSLNKINPGDFDMLLADEPHALVTEKRIKMLNAFPRARRIGFGATLEGRFDGRDSLIEGVFGPVIVERTYKEAVEEGAICPINVLFFDVVISPRYLYDHDAAYNWYLLKSEAMAQLTNRICKEVIPEDFQTLIFIKHEDQLQLYHDAIGHDCSIAMAKLLTDKERDEVTELIRVNNIKRCLCTRIYVQGVTFSDIRVLINAEGGGNNTSAIQKPGRLAEIRPGKKCGILIDFYFRPVGDDYGAVFGEGKDNWKSLCNESRARETAYKKKGYGITHVRSIETLKQEFDKLL